MDNFEHCELDMEIDPANNVKIEALYDEDFYQSIENGDLWTWIQIRVSVGGVYVVGDDQKGYAGYPKFLIPSLLESVVSVLNDETAEVEFDYHPYYLGIHPRDPKSVFIGGYHSAVSVEDPTIKLDIDTRRPATKHAWISNVIEFVENFHELMLDINPGVYEELDGIREKLEEVRDQATKHEILD